MKDNNNLENSSLLGHYRILKKLGAGGMGEVYLAEDTRLKRQVAVKVLPSDVASNQDRMRRFTQEAEAAAALNHPAIAHIYEIGEADGTHFIAMEYVEGETLREKIHVEKTDLRQLLKYLAQVAEGLSKAHQAGIVHRDLKPDNIMISADGYAKILDFGLAKLVETQKPKQSASDDKANEAETAMPPPQQLSAPGMIMGTVGYMSPEQAKGKSDLDQRSDIFSFGCVLFEAATGRQPFAGETVVDTLHKIIHQPAPPLRDFNPNLPSDLQRVVRRCLAKDADERFQSIKDVAIELKEIRREIESEGELHHSATPQQPQATESTSSGDENATAILSASSSVNQSAATETKAASAIHSTSSAEYLVGSIQKHKTGVIVALVLFLAAVAGIGYGIYRWTAKPEKPALSFQSAKITRLTTTGKASNVAISPDGKYVVHAQDEGGQQSLWMRQTATQSNVQIVAPSAVVYDTLTFSPDGNFVYYTVSGQNFPQRVLFQLPTLGGEPKKILENLDADTISFSPDGKQFVFNRNAQNIETSLVIVNADGTNERKLLTLKLPPESIGSPAWSPDAKRIAYTVLNYETNDASLFEANVADGSTRQITQRRWFRIINLAWTADGASLLMLAPAEQKFVYQIWQVDYPGSEARQLTNDLDDYEYMSLTADSKTLAVVKQTTQANIWIAPTGEMSRIHPVTSGAAKTDSHVAWTPDGSKIVYISDASGNEDIWIANADGSNLKQLTANARVNRHPTVSPDGRVIAFLSDRSGMPHIWLMNIDGSNQRQLTNGEFGEQSPQFSPDGRWLFYCTAQNVFKNSFRIAADGSGGEPVKITEKYASYPVVSPDNKLIAYFYKDDTAAPWRFAVAPVEGGEPLKTFALPATFERPLHWTGDSRAVAYIDTQNGVSNIVAQPLDGGAVKQLTDFKADRILWFDISRDGKQIALARGTINNDVVLISNFKQ